MPKYERISGLRNFSGKATLSLAVRAIHFTVANEKKTGNYLMMMVMMMFDDDPWYMHIGQWHLYEAINEYAFTIFE